MSLASKIGQVKFAQKGAQGKQGARMKWVDWDATTIWLSGTNDEEWQYYTYYNEHAYMCLQSFDKTTYTKTPAQSVSDNDGVFVIADEIFFSFINYLVVNKLTASQIDVDSLIAKNLTTDSGNCKISNNGSITAEDAVFKKSTLINNKCPWNKQEDGFNTDYADNILVQGSTGFVMSYNLPTSIDNNGRRLTIICGNKNFASGDAGRASFSIAKGYYIFENGNKSTELKLSNECVELIGLGTDTTFVGWLVLNRSDYQTVGRYGSNQKVLAVGTVDADGTLSYKSFDDSKLSCSRTEAGTYKISLPQDWVTSNSDKYTVMLTGYNGMLPTISSISASYVLITYYKNGTLTNGKFNFQIICTRDWATLNN